jgi:hypothetical protein
LGSVRERWGPKRRVSGKLVDTDYSHFYDLKTMADKDPAAFAARDLRTDFPYLGTDDRKLLIDQQDQIKKGNANDVASLSEQLTAIHETMGIQGDKVKMGKFDSATTMSMQAEADRLGRKLSYDERQAVIDRMVIVGRIHTGPIADTIRRAPIVNLFLHPDRYYYEVMGTDKAPGFKPDTDVDSIPLPERQKMGEALKRAGLPVTNKALSELYWKKMRKDGIAQSDDVHAMSDY